MSGCDDVIEVSLCWFVAECENAPICLPHLYLLSYPSYFLERLVGEAPLRSKRTPFLLLLPVEDRPSDPRARDEIDDAGVFGLGAVTTALLALPPSSSSSSPSSSSSAAALSSSSCSIGALAFALALPFCEEEEVGEAFIGICSASASGSGSGSDSATTSISTPEPLVAAANFAWLLRKRSMKALLSA